MAGRPAACATPLRLGLPASFFADPSPMQTTPQREQMPTTPLFCTLPCDVRDIVMEHFGPQTMAAFAAVDRACATSARQDSAWKRAYLTRTAGEVDCEEELPERLYRGCLLREARHKRRLTPTVHGV